MKRASMQVAALAAGLVAEAFLGEAAGLSVWISLGLMAERASFYRAQR